MSTTPEGEALRQEFDLWESLQSLLGPCALMTEVNERMTEIAEEIKDRNI